jgi:hypothetical protein
VNTAIYRFKRRYRQILQKQPEKVAVRKGEPEKRLEKVAGTVDWPRDGTAVRLDWKTPIGFWSASAVATQVPLRSDGGTAAARTFFESAEPADPACRVTCSVARRKRNRKE